MKVSEECEIVGIDECEMGEFVYVYVGLKRMFVSSGLFGATLQCGVLRLPLWFSRAPASCTGLLG